MKKVHDEARGKINWEVFKTWFPDDPELLLADFLRSDKEQLILMADIGNDKIGVVNIKKEHAVALLKERAIALVGKP